MKLTIEQVINGYILSYYDEETKKKMTIAVEEDENESDERTTQKLLWEISEYFGLCGSKHDTERCHIVIKDNNMKEID